MIACNEGPSYTQNELYPWGMLSVTQSAKHFAEKLNSCLDNTDAPTHIRERAVILSKMLDISKQQAWILLEGHTLPDSSLIQKIANEFDVDPKWLSGEK